MGLFRWLLATTLLPALASGCSEGMGGSTPAAGAPIVAHSLIQMTQASRGLVTCPPHQRVGPEQTRNGGP